VILEMTLSSPRVKESWTTSHHLYIIGASSVSEVRRLYDWVSLLLSSLLSGYTTSSVWVSGFHDGLDVAVWVLYVVSLDSLFVSCYEVTCYTRGYLSYVTTLPVSNVTVLRSPYSGLLLPLVS